MPFLPNFLPFLHQQNLLRRRPLLRGRCLELANEVEIELNGLRRINGAFNVTLINLPLYLYTTVKANNYGYANSIGVVIIIVGFITMTLINRLFGMNKED